MKTLKFVLKKNSAAILLCAILLTVNYAVFKLYAIYTEPFVYSSLIAVAFLVLFVAVDYLKEKRKKDERQHTVDSILSDYSNLPEADSLLEADYQVMINKLGRELERITEEYSEEKKDAEDYYTAWVHQIKTPIAVMKLKLSDDTPENHALSAELFRIEQYVDMVLQYIRLGSDINDLVIKEYSLDDIIKESVRKFAPQFVEKKLRLDYVATDESIVTDRKWFSCILEQFLSNAIKYTGEGTISITVANDKLTVSDTGIGIAAEDLPRIFEKGYTGNNGRIGQKSSGLGLYLAKKAADMLSLSISAQSEVGKGSSFTIDYSKS